MSVRVRFAPSPTGALHIGGIRTALYNYLFAKKNNGTFILRIEDTDQTRYVPGAEQYIQDALEWCGLTIDEGVGKGGEYGPYRQSERKEAGIYQSFAQQLVDAGKAYYAFDTPEELDIMRDNLSKQGNPSPQYNAITRQYMKNSTSLSAEEVKKRLDNKDQYVIRLKVDRGEEIKFHDVIRGWVSFQSNQLDDKVLLKNDGMPTYHLANVVDDYLMKITHVIRGEEWLPSTPTHVMLYQAFGWEDVMPIFSHLPLILKPDGKGKLSKRDGDKLGIPVFPLDWIDNENPDNNFKGFREMGFFPEAMINFLSLLGWSPEDDHELLTMEALIEQFSLERIHKAGARFDFDKSKWFNQQYIKSTDDNLLAELAQPLFEAKGYNIKSINLPVLCSMLKERVEFMTDFPVHGYYFFEDVKEYDVKTISKKWKSERKPFFENLANTLAALPTFDHTAIDTVIKTFMADNNLGFGEVLPIIRVALTGTMQGPPVFEMMELMGVDFVHHRLLKAFQDFESL